MRGPVIAWWLVAALGCHAEAPTVATTPPIGSAPAIDSAAPQPEASSAPSNRRPAQPCVDSAACSAGSDAPEARGELPREVIQKTIRDNFGRFRACYAEELRKDPKLAGRLDVRFVIGRDGAVVNVMVIASTLPKMVADCAAKAFYQLQFPPPRGGDVVVSYPLVLSRGERPPRGAPSAQ